MEYPETSGPSATTVPTLSCPGMIVALCGAGSPSVDVQVGAVHPQVRTCTTNSPGYGEGIGLVP